MLELPLQHDPRRPLHVLCLGAHSDDIEIGCGGTILRLIELYLAASFTWIVFSAESDTRKHEALAGAARFLADAAAQNVVVKDFRVTFFPADATAIKEYFEERKSAGDPDLIFTHYRHDLHQDHKLISDLTWNTFRNSLILEYEIPKWDGDLGRPNVYVPVERQHADRKVEILLDAFPSQRDKHWFSEETFRAVMRIRGIESKAPSGYAEAFHCRKLAIG